MRDAGQQRRGLFLLRRHGLDGLLLILGQQEVAGCQFDGADWRRLSEAPVHAGTVCAHQRPKIRLVQIAGRLGLMIVPTEAVLEGQWGAEAIRWLDPSKVLPEGVRRTPCNHLSVQRVQRTVCTVVNIGLQEEKQGGIETNGKIKAVWAGSYLTSSSLKGKEINTSSRKNSSKASVLSPILFSCSSFTCFSRSFSSSSFKATGKIHFHGYLYQITAGQMTISTLVTISNYKEYKTAAMKQLQSWGGKKYFLRNLKSGSESTCCHLFLSASFLI